MEVLRAATNERSLMQSGRRHQTTVKSGRNQVQLLAPSAALRLPHVLRVITFRRVLWHSEGLLFCLFLFGSFPSLDAAIARDWNQFQGWTQQLFGAIKGMGSSD